MQETLCQTLATMNYYLNVNDVSELLGVQRETIYRYCKENFLPHVKIGNNLRFDPRLLAIWIQEHEFAARGSVADKITDWVVAHVLDRTLNLPVPDQLTKVLAGLSEHWLADALRDQAQDLASGCYSQPFRTFQAELNRQLSLAEQRELLAELLWLGRRFIDEGVGDNAPIEFSRRAIRVLRRIADRRSVKFQSSFRNAL